jgi:transposase InsO family protein
VQRVLDVSERRACKALGHPRSTHRYEARKGEEERVLVARMHELVRKHPRYGYRRIGALLRREGFRVNIKRVHRLWRREGLRVRKRQRKRIRLGSSDGGCIRLRAERRNHVWSMDFAHDRTESGKPLKILAIVDEYTREGLALAVAKNLRASDVIDVLEGLFRERGMPEHVRSDNGPEFIAHELREWLGRRDVAPLYIAPGSPWENGYGEAFIGRVRDEKLDRELFTSLVEAQVVLGDWLVEYNTERPHGSLDQMTPLEFATRWSAANSAPLRLPQTSELEQVALK